MEICVQPEILLQHLEAPGKTATMTSYLQMLTDTTGMKDRIRDL